MNAWSPYPSAPPPFDGFRRAWLSLPPVTARLIQINIAVFFLFGLGHLLRNPVLASLESWLALSLPGLRHGALWQPVTYMFLHAGFWHIFLNMMTLFCLGPETERSMGPRHYLAMYLLSGVAGALGWLWLTPNPASFCVGASGAIFGVMAAFATLYPNRQLTIVFLIPVTTAAWKAVLGLAALQFLLITGGDSSNIAYAAHLAGAFAGFLYIDRLYESAFCRRLLNRVWSFLTRRRPPRFSASASSRPAPDRAEIDRILDKISREGIQSLTREERQALHRASAKF